MEQGPVRLSRLKGMFSRISSLVEGRALRSVCELIFLELTSVVFSLRFSLRKYLTLCSEQQ